MADEGRSVESGQPIRIAANDFNGFLDVSDWYKRQQQSFRDGEGRGYNKRTILVRNDSDDDFDRFAAVQLGDPCILPADNRSAFENDWSRALSGTVPTVPDAIGRFGLTVAPIPKGLIGLVVIEGVMPCKLKMFPQPDDPTIVGDWYWADIEDGQSKNLIVHPGGSASILWRSDEDGDDGFRDALVRLDFGSNNATISGIANGACSVDSMGKCTPNYPLNAPDVDFFNPLADIDDGARIEIHWERQPARFCLGPATCSDT